MEEPKFDINGEYDRNAALQRWYFLQQKINEAAPYVEEEKRLRLHIFGQEFPNAERTQNAKRVEFGMALVGKPRTNWSVDRPAVEEAIKSNSNIKPLIEEVIDFAPKVRDGAYEKLSDDDKLAIAPFLTARPGTPEMELRPQKGVKKYTA